MTRPITYFSIYRSNGRGLGGRGKGIEGQQVLSVLGFGGWVGRPPLPQTLNIGKRGPLLEEINKELSWSRQARPPGPAAEMTREEVTLRLNRKDRGPLGGSGRTSSRPMRRAGGRGRVRWRLWRLSAPSALAHQGASSGEVHGAGAQGAAVRKTRASRLWAESM